MRIAAVGARARAASGVRACARRASGAGMKQRVDALRGRRGEEAARVGAFLMASAAGARAVLGACGGRYWAPGGEC